ncbi:small ribosomal subunit protein mS80 (rPPR6) [Cryptomeria japonica]|uniref:small ribosomal subunit protein mS80 (rPPR6) n=1 Tax=Cryptomeria japonica TaxID=3369 RepID=UPI0027DA0914|nr:small ribosomal subunit protein mS80 (rPPR6) [Cryptomeria japonica]XP_057849425.2 small ribosomal subunit protein mS80 (rPPR6) [Cryptomeria japonica]
MWRSKAGLIFRAVSSAVNTSFTCIGTKKVRIASMTPQNQVMSAIPICLYSSAVLHFENFVNHNDSNEESENVLNPNNDSNEEYENDLSPNESKEEPYGSDESQIKNTPTLGNSENSNFSEKKKRDIENVVRLLKEKWEVQELEPQLQALDLSIGGSMLVKIVKNPDIDCQQFDRFFRWVLKQPKYIPSSGVIHSITTAICNKGSGDGLNIMRKLFQELAEKHKGVVTTSSLDTLSDYLWRAKRVTQARKIFNRYEEFNCERGPKSYLVTFSGLCMASMFDEAFTVLEGMKKAHFFPGNVGSAASTIVKEFCKSKRPKDAHMIYLKLMENGIFPGIASLISLVDSLCNDAVNPDTAAEILQTIPSGERRHSSKAYSTIIRTFCNNEQIEEAQALLSKMVADGPRPDHATYNSIITALCRAERPEEAISLLEHMATRQLKPDIYAFNVITASFSRAGKMEEACDVYSKAKQSHINKIPFITYKILIDGFCKLGDTKKAYQYFSELQNSGHSPNRDLYTKLIRAHVVEALDWHTAEMLLQEMENRGFQPSLHIRSLLVATKELKEEALRAYAEQIKG